MGQTGGPVLVTAVDRFSRYTLIGWAQKKEATAVNTALSQMFSSIPKEFCLSFTPDHGTEFLQLSQIQERLGIMIYWPDPYSPEQRGTNENTNGLIREYFPSHQTIKNDTAACQSALNHRPRKVLNYKTPHEIFYDEVLHLV